jgi:branched-chain amino acid transport system substrate-binding protein
VRGVAGLVLLVVAALLPASPATGQDITIGVAAPLTGNLAHIGQQLVEGAQLAVDGANAGGGIAGRRVALRTLDDQADPRAALTVARQFAVDDAILAVLGHYSASATLAAMPTYTKARLAAVTPSAMIADLAKGSSKYLFRMQPSSAAYAQNLARYAVQTLGKKSIAVIYGQSDWGVRTKDAFVKTLTSLGARVATLQVVQEGDTDVKAQLKKIKAANPDALAILTYYTTGALVTLQTRNLEMRTPLIGTGVLAEDRFIELAGPGNAEGITVNTDFSADDPAPEVRRFVAAFQARHPHQKPGAYHAFAYDAARVILDAIEKAGAQRDAVRDAIAATTSFAGVTGTFAFNDVGQREATDQAYLAVKDGEWTLVGRH